MRIDHITGLNAGITAFLPTLDKAILECQSELERLTRFRAVVSQFAETSLTPEPAQAAAQNAVEAAVSRLVGDQMAGQVVGSIASTDAIPPVGSVEAAA